MTRKLAGLLVAALAVAVMLSACGGDDDDDTGGANATTQPAATSAAAGTSPTKAAASATDAAAESGGIIAIGHWALTGVGTGGTTGGGGDVTANSWATGTNPEVNSIYQRMIAVLPETEGKAANTANNDAVAADLPAQATAALAIVPKPALVIVQIVENEIRCDDTEQANIEAFGESITETLQTIADAAPEAKVLLVSEVGTTPSFNAALSNNPDFVAAMGGAGPCDLYTRAGTLRESAIDTVDSAAAAYDEKAATVCAEFDNCHTDNRAATEQYTFAATDIIQFDWGHFSVTGLAHLAQVMWPTVAEILGVPAS